MAYITCRVCGFTAPEAFFQAEVKRIVVSRVKRQFHRRICLMCRQEEQDKHKRGDRTVPKARNMIYTHCEKYNRRNGTTLKPMEFARKFGWDLKRITHDIEHNFNNWCPYCESPFDSMEHGLAALTLDIRDPSQPPYYNNVLYCCSTCNKRKGQMGPAEFGLFLSLVKQRREFLNSEHGTLGKPQYKMEIGCNEV
ncbi:hypothetical protein ES703_04920 [subsurface metagenome]